MKDTISYRPYRLHLILLVFMLPFSVLSFVAAGYCLTCYKLSALVLIGFGIASMWLSKVLYDTSHVVVFFEPKGLRIAGSRYKDHYYLNWEDVSYAYYARNFKGHLFLVLSPKGLSPKEIKKFVNRGANSSKICIEYVYVIYMDASQDVTQLQEVVKNHMGGQKTGDGFA